MSKRQSLGTAFRRDGRRKVALETLERKAQAYKDLLADKKHSAQPNTKFPGKTNGQVYQDKLAKTEETIANTQANLGKGSAALG